jgi:hypothetical protein
LSAEQPLGWQGETSFSFVSIADELGYAPLQVGSMNFAVATVPIPAAVWLFGSGEFGVAEAKINRLTETEIHS